MPKTKDNAVDKLIKEWSKMIPANVNIPPVLPAVQEQEYNPYYFLDEAYVDVFKFNDIAGNTLRTEYQDLLNQAALIKEETTELIEALNANDSTETLDAVCDLFVVWSGLVSKLISLGFDVGPALEKTNLNNLSKFPESLASTIMQTVEKYKAKGVELDILHREDGRLVFRNKNTGKIVKPSTYEPNDLSEFVPEEFKQGFVTIN